MPVANRVMHSICHGHGTMNRNVSYWTGFPAWPVGAKVEIVE